MFRLANARSNFISEATAKVWSVGATVSEEGRRMVGFEPMPLLKSENPTFALSWTLFHPIDERSPLFGMDRETLAASGINFAIVIVGFDETSGQTLHARDVFAAQDVRWGHEFADIIRIDGEGMRHIDYAKIDETRLAAPSAGAAEDNPSPNPEMEPAVGADQVTEDERR
jgi:inward rectifier potassium channel